jgi:hypothetical protein
MRRRLPTWPRSPRTDPESQEIQLTDRVATALDVAEAKVLRRPELDDLVLDDEIMEEFCRVVRAWTADHP